MLMLEGFEFFEDGFACTRSPLSLLAHVRVVHYDDFLWMKVSEQWGGIDREREFIFTILLRAGEPFVVTSLEQDTIIRVHNEMFAKYLEYKRHPKTSTVLHRLAQSHAALASCAARFLDEIEMVPGVPGGASEAAVERCKKRARGEEGEK